MSVRHGLSDEQSQLNIRLDAHMVYLCPECGRAFRTQVEWRQHLNTKHDYLNKTHTDFNFVQIDENFHECLTCFKWVENASKTIALLQYHYFSHLDLKQTYRCVHCDSSYTRRRALNTHLLTEHLKEIELYEAKVKRSKVLKGAAKSTTIKKNDLLEKALMDIDLQAEDPNEAASASASATSSTIKSNANESEKALDRSLIAYETLLRTEESPHQSSGQSREGKYEADLEALCQEFFADRLDNPNPVKAIEEKPKTDKELVIIEIDALDPREIDKLKKKMTKESDADAEPDADNTSPSPKRKRLTATPTREADISGDLSPDGLAKLVSFLCPTCGKEIDSMDDWRQHVFKKHDFEHFIEHSFKLKDGKSVCLKCHEVLNTNKRTELQKHCFKHLPYRSYLKCTICDRTKTSMSKMQNHIRYNHQDILQRINKTQLLIKPEPKWTSTQRLGKALENKDMIKSNVENEDEYTCTICKRSYKTAWRFERHLAEVCNRKSRKGAKTSEYTSDTLLQHLREGQLRIDDVWKQIQLDN